MMQIPRNELMMTFNDPTYAWQLLEWQIAVQMNQSLSGEAIAKLLELYMRGVEKMNSIMDMRQSYFKNKVTSLMMKGSVVKTLNKPPMAKKQKPLQITAKQLIIQNKPNIKKQIKIQKKNQVNPYLLQQKKKQMQMRLAYQAQSNSVDNVTQLYTQQLKKQQKFHSTVKNILNDHDQQLKKRINRRKLKTATYRSQVQIQPGHQPRRKQLEDHFNFTSILQRKKIHSMQNKVKHDLQIQQSPKKVRKMTFDINKKQNSTQSFQNQLIQKSLIKIYITQESKNQNTHQNVSIDEKNK